MRYLKNSYQLLKYNYNMSVKREDRNSFQIYCEIKKFKLLFTQKLKKSIEDIVQDSQEISNTMTIEIKEPQHLANKAQHHVDTDNLFYQKSIRISKTNILRCKIIKPQFILLEELSNSPILFGSEKNAYISLQRQNLPFDYFNQDPR